MQESATYQALRKEAREEGLAKGREEAKQETLLLLGEKRLGQPSQRIRERVREIRESQKLDRLLLRVLDAESWDELLAEATDSSSGE